MPAPLLDDQDTDQLDNQVDQTVANTDPFRWNVPTNRFYNPPFHITTPTSSITTPKAVGDIFVIDDPLPVSKK